MRAAVPRPARTCFSSDPVVAIDRSGASLASKISNVSLRMTDAEAGQLAFTSDSGKIWLALRPSVGAKSTKPSLVTVSTILLGVRPIVVQRALGGR
jgi:hypothetical protein